MKTLKYLLIFAAAGVCLATVPKASALLIHDSHELGFVNFGIPSGDADRTLYVNHLVNQALGTIEMADGQVYTRSLNDFGPLAGAVFALNGTSTTIDLGTGYQYLFAKYDGPNYGSEVWYVGDLSGTITIPALAGQYGLSGWTLFTPGGDQVPDGGTTVTLLGAALAGTGLLRRYASR